MFCISTTMADKDDVLSLFGHSGDSLDAGNVNGDGSDNENDPHMPDSPADVVGDERTLRSRTNKPVRGRGWGRASSLSMPKPKVGRGFKRPASSDTNIKKLRQQLRLNKLESSMTTLTHILVERSTEGRGRGHTHKTVYWL